MGVGGGEDEFVGAEALAIRLVAQPASRVAKAIASRHGTLEETDMVGEDRVQRDPRGLGVRPTFTMPRGGRKSGWKRGVR